MEEGSKKYKLFKQTFKGILSILLGIGLSYLIGYLFGLNTILSIIGGCLIILGLIILVGRFILNWFSNNFRV